MNKKQITMGIGIIIAGVLLSWFIWQFRVETVVAPIVSPTPIQTMFPEDFNTGK